MALFNCLFEDKDDDDVDDDAKVIFMATQSVPSMFKIKSLSLSEQFVWTT